MKKQLINFSQVCALALSLMVVTHCGSSNDGKPEATPNGNRFSYLFNAPPAGAPLTRNQILGTWVFKSVRQVGGTAEARMHIDKNAMIFAMQCKYDDGSVITVGLDVGVTHAANSFTVASDKADTITIGKRSCSTSFKGGEYLYFINGVDLTLLNAVGNLRTATKLKD